MIFLQVEDKTSDPQMAMAIMDRVRSVDDTALSFKVILWFDSIVI